MEYEHYIFLVLALYFHLSHFATRLYDTGFATAAVDAFKAGLWSGDLVLHDLRVRTDISRKLHLPIVLKQGSVELVRLQARNARFWRLSRRLLTVCFTVSPPPRLLMLY